VERQTLPLRPAGGFPIKKIFEGELPLAGGKRSTASWAGYIRVNGLGHSLGLRDFIKRTAVRAGEINLRSLDRDTALRRLDCGRRERFDEAGASALTLM